MKVPGLGRALLVLMSAVSLLVPAEALAHLRLVSTNPASGARLSVSPAIVRLAFSVRPELALSDLLLVSVAGDTIALTPLTYEATDQKVLRSIPRAPLGGGRYVVSWRTASADGHPIKGQFEFSVDASPVSTSVPNEHDGHVVRDPPGTPADAPGSMGALGSTGISQWLPILAAGTRALSFAALFALLGSVSFRFAVLPRLWRWQNGKREVGALFRARRIALGACGVFLVAHVARLLVEGTMLLGDASELSSTRLGEAVAGTAWGTAWLVGLGGVVLALVGLAGTGGRPRLGWHGALAGSGLLALSAALAGHAAAEFDAGLAVAVAAVHFLAAAAWLGTLLIVLAAGVPAALWDGRGDAPHEGVAELLVAFSPVALVSATVAVTTGSYMTWTHLPAWRAFIDTQYGNVLLVKLALLGAVSLLGFFHWRVALPRLGDQAGTERVTRTARGELMVGALMVAVSAVLVATPLPGD